MRPCLTDRERCRFAPFVSDQLIEDLETAHHWVATDSGDDDTLYRRAALEILTLREKVEKLRPR